MPRITGAVTPRKLRQLLTAGAELPTYTVATLPLAADNVGRIVRCSNGAAGAPCLALSNGTAWLRTLVGAAVSVTV